MMIIHWICLSLLLFNCATYSDEVPIIKPSRLQIGTVIDTTNDEIVRDAINFLKSIRMFGKSMNEAAMLVGITGSYTNCSVDNTLLPFLVSMGVEVVFIAQTVKYAKTLNKFKIFDLFDSTKYDYFLWLDADIIVFDDPIPYLHMHMYPGEIECVPDFYSYMRRFPAVNISTDYWNPRLATFHLLGEYESAPNGLCNTGLLYFDTLSLSNFREGLHSVLNNKTYLETHGSDRFVDSLIFTKVVHDLALAVSVLPYSLNYMALFEIEIREEVPVSNIVMAHLVSDTELYCVASLSTVSDESGDCFCVYRNKLMPPEGSLLRDTVQQKLLSSRDTCLVFAGTGMPALPDSVSHRPASRLPQHNSFINLQGDLDRAVSLHGCELLTPPREGWILHMPSTLDATALIDVSIVCSMSPGILGAAQPLVQLVVRNDITHRVDQRSVHNSALRVLLAAAPQCTGDTCTILFEYSIELKVPEYIVQSVNSAIPMTELSLKIGVELHGVEQTALEISSDFSVIFEDLLFPGQVHYSTNLLLSAKSLALESQMLLPQFLNVHNMRGTGVVACCDTHKGVTTTKRLIDLWRGDHLLIIVERAPWQASSANENADFRDKIAEEFRQHCNRRMEADRSNNQFMCHISIAPVAAHASSAGDGVSLTRRLVTALRANSAQFVYLDAVFPFTEHRAVLSEFLRVLAKGGMLMSTQYSAAQRTCSSDFDWNNPPVDANSPKCTRFILKDTEQKQVLVETQKQLLCAADYHRRNSRRALDSLLWRLSQNVLLTFSERDPHFCDSLVRRRLHANDAHKTEAIDRSTDEAQSVECAPAWYLFKQRNIW